MKPAQTCDDKEEVTVLFSIPMFHKILENGAQTSLKLKDLCVCFVDVVSGRTFQPSKRSHQLLDVLPNDKASQGGLDGNQGLGEMEEGHVGMMYITPDLDKVDVGLERNILEHEKGSRTRRFLELSTQNNCTYIIIIIIITSNVTIEESLQKECSNQWHQMLWIFLQEEISQIMKFIAQ